MANRFPLPPSAPSPDDGPTAARFDSSLFQSTLTSLFPLVHAHALSHLHFSHLPPDFLASRVSEGILTLNHYPADVAVNVGDVLLGAHVDVDFLTFLFPLSPSAASPSSAGLQILSGGEWKTITIPDGGCVVNAGDSFADWLAVHPPSSAAMPSAAIKSTVHRVARVRPVSRGEGGRLTVAYFLPLGAEATMDDPNDPGVKGVSASKWRSKRVKRALKEARK